MNEQAQVEFSHKFLRAAGRLILDGPALEKTKHDIVDLMAEALAMSLSGKVVSVMITPKIVDGVFMGMHLGQTDADGGVEQDAIEQEDLVKAMVPSLLKKISSQAGHKNIGEILAAALGANVREADDCDCENCTARRAETKKSAH